MASNFSALWSTSWSLVYKLLNLPLPIYFGGSALTFMDIIIGTVGILVAFASIRALLSSGFTIAGKELIAEYNHQQKIRALNEQLHAEYYARSHVHEYPTLRLEAHKTRGRK